MINAIVLHEYIIFEHSNVQNFDLIIIEEVRIVQPSTLPNGLTKSNNSSSVSLSIGMHCQYNFVIDLGRRNF